MFWAFPQVPVAVKCRINSTWVVLEPLFWIVAHIHYMRRLFLVCEWCCTSWEDTCCLQDVWIHRKDFCSALVYFHGLVPNLEIQAQYLQTVLGSFSSFMFPVAKITWKKRVMVWIWIIASLKEELLYERRAQVCLLSAQIIDLLIKLCARGAAEPTDSALLLLTHIPLNISIFAV